MKESGRERKSVSTKYGAPDFCEPVHDFRTRLDAMPSVSRRVKEYNLPFDRGRVVHHDPTLNRRWEEHRNVSEFQPQACSAQCIDASERILPRPVMICSVVDTNVARSKVSGLSTYLNVVSVVANHGEKIIAA